MSIYFRASEAKLLTEPDKQFIQKIISNTVNTVSRNYDEYIDLLLYNKNNLENV